MRILILIVVFFACGSSKPEKDQTVNPMANLEQTKWLFKVVDGVYNYYEFTSKADFKYYSAELEDMFYGYYEVENDTLYTFVNISAGDSLLEANSSHRSQKAKEKLVMKNDKLLLVYQELEFGSGWKTIETPPNLFYIKED